MGRELRWTPGLTPTLPPGQTHSPATKFHPCNSAGLTLLFGPSTMIAASINKRVRPTAAQGSII